MKYIFSLLLFCGTFATTLAQRTVSAPTPIGTWRTHLNYTQSRTVARVGTRIYSASPTNFFYFDQADSTLRTLSRLDGFSEVGITRLRYYAERDVLFVGYEGGNIDLLRGQRVTILRDIARQENLVGARRINQVAFRGELAYVATGFGLVVLDLVRDEFRAAFLNLGTDGSQVEIFDATVLEDALWLATTDGVVRLRLGADGLPQPQTLTRFLPGADGLPPAPIRFLATHEDAVYAAPVGTGLYQFDGQAWTRSPLVPDFLFVQGLRTEDSHLLVSTFTGLWQIRGGEVVARSQDIRTVDVVDALRDAAGAAWLASPSAGLLSQRDTALVSVSPNGPRGVGIHDLYSYNDRVILLHGGFDQGNLVQQRNLEGFSVLDGTQWQSIVQLDGHLLFDATTAAYNPVTDKLYIGMHGEGLLEIAADSQVTLFNPANSLLATALPGADPGFDFVRVSGLAVDQVGTLWIAQSTLPNEHLKSLDREGNFQTYDFDFLSISDRRSPLKLAIDGNGFVWMMITGEGGVGVFDPRTGRARNLVSQEGQGGLPSNTVRDILADQNGDIWVATSRGPAVFRNTAFVFEGAVNADRPRFRVGENLFTILLEDEPILSLAVDGGNRKWVGTANGLYLFSPDGSEQLNFFNTRNSPLPTNEVIRLAINDVTGEVFAATARGVYSYRSDATRATQTHTDVKVFPNPVRPEFQGTVAISGLAANAVVKITDVSGKLIFETRANGGTATWNRRDYNGRRAQTGIYLVFSADLEGDETFVTKIAVID